MFKKGTKLYGITKEKCPRCHEGDFFAHKFTFHPKKVTKIHTNCPQCNLKYMLEPSFFYGAMYVNYGITVAFSMLIFFIVKLGFNFNLLQSFAVIFLTLILLAPFNLRLARILWIYMFVSYDKKV